VTTDRTVTAAGFDRLHGAGQFTTFDLPAYAEQVLAGTGTFALNYAAKQATDSRSELGVRTDRSFAMQNGILTLRGRLAWAHDFNPDRGVPDAARCILHRERRGAGARFRADHGFRRAEMAERLVGGGHIRR
jgi:hypothetical protein